MNMSTQTPEQIAARLADSVMWSSDKTALLSGERLERIIASAIRADRAQRPKLINCDNEGMDNALAVEVYDCLKDRETAAAERAAEWVAENENGAFWDRFVGPMLDEIEEIA